MKLHSNSNVIFLNILYQYVYTKLGDLAPGNKLHCFGIVKQAWGPAPQKNCNNHQTSYSLRLVLYDESCPEFEAKFFAPTIDPLPLAHVDDVLRFHRVNVVRFEPHLYCTY